MDGQVHTIPDDTAAHYERLITEAEKMRQAGADALKAAYADLRADLKQLGWAGASISAEVAAFKGAIAEMALAEADKTKRDEKGERVDDYVSLLTRARARGQRKSDERFDPITGEFVDDIETSDGSPSVSSSLTTCEVEESVVSNSPATAAVPSSEQSEGNGSRDHQHVHSRQTDEAKHGGQDGEPAGADHATHLPDTANEVPAQDGGGTALGESHGDKSNAARPASVDAHVNDGRLAGQVSAEVVTVVGTESGTVAISQSDDGAIAEVKGSARLANADGVEPPSSVQIDPTEDREEGHSLDGNADANAGGTDVESSAPRAGLAAQTSNTGEGAANTALPANGIVMEYVPQSGVKRLPFASCFPEHSKAEYERLEKDIAASRVQTPIIRQGDVIVDGFARYTIARKYGFAYPVQEYTGTDVLLNVIEWQRAARNFTPAQEKKIAADLAKELPHRADDIMAAFGLAEALEDVA